jgi:serine O-acetyltransferase
MNVNNTRLLKIIEKQLESLFLVQDSDHDILSNSMEEVLEKCKKSFSYVNDKYYKSGNFNPYNSSQYATFLYFLSNYIWNKYGDSDLCDRIFYLNKALNCVDLFYQIDLPEVFYLEHPMGSILGRAKYGKFLSVSQGVTVGKNKMKTAVLGDFVTLFSQSMVIGECAIGNNVIISAGTIVKDAIIPDNCIVFGTSPNLIIKEKTKDEIYNIIKDRWDFNYVFSME